MTNKRELWRCPKCKRQFERHGQPHSCKPFPLEQHFVGKDSSKVLYEKFKQSVRKQVGSFKIESLECCIHFVSTFTFAAVKPYKSKIQVEFDLGHNIKSKRIDKSVRMSTNQYLYYVNIFNEEEIDEELMEWIQEASSKRVEKTVAV
jgi:Domain of unknown function (DUF5655)